MPLGVDVKGKPGSLFLALSSVILWQQGSSVENPVKEQGRQCSFEVGEESRRRQNGVYLGLYLALHFHVWDLKEEVFQQAVDLDLGESITGHV